jgi:hypothetical protein
MVKMYTKGDKNNIMTRVEQVSDVTIYIPTAKKCVDYLYDVLVTLCNYYVDEEGDSNKFSHIPYIDYYNVVLYVNKCCVEKNVDADYILTTLSILKTFTNLKWISVVFKDDDDTLISLYDRLVNINLNNISKNEIIKELTNAYTIDALEIYFGDMFDQKIIDLINKSFISNGIISNSYLEREFLITFEFDEYISYINMFVDNNIERLDMLDENIVDYLQTFPPIISDVWKPNIKLYTNYKEN